MKKFLKTILLGLLVCLITSCGFHPRGMTPLVPPLKRMYLKTDSPYSDLTNNLRQYLKMSDVYLTTTPQDATTVLDIISVDQVQQLLGVSGSQQTRQYSLTLSVKFQITDPKGVVLVMPETLSQARTLPINSGEVLAGSNQAAALYQQMRRAIVFDIMNRISSQYISNLLLRPPHHETATSTIGTTPQ